MAKQKEVQRWSVPCRDWRQTKMGDGNIFFVDELVTVKTKFGLNNTAYGWYATNPNSYTHIDPSRLTHSVTHLEVQEYLLERRLRAFESMLNRQVKELEGEIQCQR